jgi:hypothetical protein
MRRAADCAKASDLCTASSMSRPGRTSSSRRRRPPGPWSIDAQHGGPPSALAARAMEACEPTENQRLASVLVDIVRPVPLGKITTRTRRAARSAGPLEGRPRVGYLTAMDWRYVSGGGLDTPGPAAA